MKFLKNYQYIIVLSITVFFLAFEGDVYAQPNSDISWKTKGDGISIPVPPSVHPRLYLRSHDIDDLRRRVNHPVLKPVWDDLQKAAKENVQVRIEVDAIRYLVSNDADLGKKTLALALETLKNAQYDPSAQDVTRPIGRMMVTGAVAYDWCYPLLTPVQKNEFQEQLIRLAEQLECGYPPRAIGCVTGHGSEWMIMRDMLSAGIALYDENQEMYEYAAEAFFSGHLPARNFWYPGHAFHQGTAYSETRFSSELYPLWIFDRMGAGNVYHPSQQFVPYQWIYIRRGDGQLLRAGDGQNRVPKLRSLLSASYYKDGYILSDYLQNPGNSTMNQLFELLWSDPDLEPQPISDLPLTRYMGFPYGWMVARTGWDANAVVAEMKVNIYHFGNHQHHDGGAFQIYYKGPLAVDAGVYRVYTSDHNRAYNQRTIAHNSLLIYDPEEQFNSRPEFVNDGGQRLPNNRREPKDLPVLLDPKNEYLTGEVLAQGFGPDGNKPDYSYLKGDITKAYSSKVKEVKRTFAFLNLKDDNIPAALIVFDKVVSSNPEFKKFWLLHSMEEPAISGNNTTIALNQRGWTGKMVNTTLLPEAKNMELIPVGGPGKEFWVFGKNYESLPLRGDPDDFETGDWRVELIPGKPSAEDYFLNVMQVMDKSYAKNLPVERIQGEMTTGVKISDRIVLFSKTSDVLDRHFTVSLPEGGKYKILLTDLLPGNWQVKKDNKVIMPVVAVRNEEGTIYFEGSGGEYSFLR
jgi:hypothetical protein